ncbi:MAG TPA: trypsin-like peptidase domain-containing protein [Terriglobales bacterium]|nr:trypsin-like peptidase domain-containing protein [Terriglobales bacterium]
MRMRTVLALALIMAGAFWFYAASRSGAAYPPFLHGVLPQAAAGRPVALAEAPPQTNFSPQETRDISIYKRVSPSVVNITSQIIQYNLLWGPVPASGQGSGFFINRDGYILTNYHVIAGARRLTVTWTPQKDRSRQFPATVVGSAPELDLAVIRIAASRLPPVTLGDSANLQVGQQVLAIGNPYGLPGTMTQGIISSIRTVREGQQDNGRPGADIEGAIQTDAPINPGNSGGPLLNSLGEVIGIDTMIYSQTGSNIGIGFAIPINSAKAVLQQLLTTGRVQTVSLGVQSYPVSPDVAQQLGLGVDHGLMVLGVRPGSLAARAGLRVGSQPGYIGNTPVRFGGDIILAANGEPLQDQGQLSNILLLQKPGSTVTLTVLRQGRQVQVPITLGTEK